jgi:hypothetical protein
LERACASPEEFEAEEEEEKAIDRGGRREEGACVFIGT